MTCLGYDAGKWMESSAFERYTSAINASRNPSSFPATEDRLKNSIELMGESSRLFSRLGNERMVNNSKGWIAFWKSRLDWIKALKEENESIMVATAQNAVNNIEEASKLFSLANNFDKVNRCQIRKYNMLSIVAKKLNKYEDCKRYINEGLKLAIRSNDDHQIHYFTGGLREVEAWELAYHRFQELDESTLALGGEIFARIAAKFGEAESEYSESKDCKQHSTSMYAWKNLFKFYQNPDPENIQSWYAFTSNVNIDALMKTQAIEKASERKKLKVSIYLSVQDLFKTVSKQFPIILAMTAVGYAQDLEQWLLELRSKTSPSYFRDKKGNRVSASLDSTIRFFIDMHIDVPKSIIWVTFELNKPFKHGALRNPRDYQNLLSEASKNEGLIIGQLSNDIELFKQKLEDTFKIK